MLIMNQTGFTKFVEKGTRVLQHAFVYIMSKNLDISTNESGKSVIDGNDKLLSLRPSDELLKKFTAGEISKGKFRDAYFEELGSDENKFLIYTIIRSLNEKKYLPVFICTDADWEIGFLKLLAKYLEKKYGLKGLKPKKYAKEIRNLWKSAKRENKKSKAAKKEFKKLVKSFIKDNVQLSFEGIEKLEKMEKKFAVIRIVILLNQAADEADQISKGAIIKAIENFSDFNKDARKLVKECVSDLGISKKSDRWSRKDATNLALQVYSKTMGADEK